MRKLPLLFVLLFLGTGFAENITQLDIMLPAVSQNETTGATYGVVVRLNVKLMYPGTGEIFLNTRSLTEMDMQGSARIAAMVAGELTQADTSKYDFLLTLYANSTIIGGPSAGAAITVAMIALLEGVNLSNDVMMTGMISPDGSVGVVGGIAEKAHAAAEWGAKYFLIPEGQALTYNSTTFEPVNVTQLAGERWNLTVIEVSDISEAVPWFTSLSFPRAPFPTTPLATEKYLEIMRQQCLEDIAQANLSLSEALNLSSSPDIDPAQLPTIQNYVNTSRERLEEALSAFNESSFYVASSKAFQSRIFSRSAANMARYYSASEGKRDAVMDQVWSEVQGRIDEAKRALNGTETRGITSLECYAAADSRELDAESHLSNSHTFYSLNDPETALYEAGYAFERAGTVLSWLQLADLYAGRLSTSPHDLSDMAQRVFSDASVMATYADLLYSEVFGLPIQWIVIFFPQFSFIDPYEPLDRAGGALDEGRWAAATFLSLESEVRSTVAIKFIDILVLSNDDEEVLQRLRDVANSSMERARVSIEESRRMGVEPVLSVSRYEFSQDLLQYNDTSIVGEAVFGFMCARSTARLTPSLLALYSPRLKVFVSNGSLVSGNLTVEGVAEDPNGDDMNLTVSLGNFSQTLAVSPGEFCLSIPTESVGDGSHRLTVNLTDGALFQSLSYILVVDNRPPVISVDGVVDGAAYSHPVTLNISVTDTVDPSPNVTQTLDGAEIPGEVSSEGRHSLVITATDEAGWTSRLVLNFTVDMSPPAIQLVSPVRNGTFQQPPLNVVWLAADEVTSINRCVARIDEEGWMNITGTPLEGRAEQVFNETWDADEGRHTVSIRVWDEAGNSRNLFLELVSDASPPVINVQGVSDGQWLNLPVSPEISVQDDLDPSATWNARLDGNPYLSGTRIGPGQHELSVEARDAAGNLAHSNIRFTVDIEAPTLHVNISDGAVFNRPVKVAAYAEDDLDPHYNFLSRLDGQPYTGQRIGTGHHVLELYANDHSGNRAHLSLRFTVDLQPPSLEVPLANLSWHRDALDIEVVVADDLDPSPRLDVTVDGAAQEGPRIVLSSEGRHAIGLRAKDQAGNAAEEALVVFIDWTPPSVSLSRVSNGTFDRYLSPSITVADNVDPQPQTTISLDGSPYQQGEVIRDGFHQLLVRSVDHANNTAKALCRFTIDTHPPQIDAEVADGATYRAPFKPRIAARDELGNSTLIIYLDGYRYTVGQRIGPGKHTMTIVARDDVGNEARMKLVFKVRAKTPLGTAGAFMALAVLVVAVLLLRGRKQPRRRTGRGL